MIELSYFDVIFLVINYFVFLRAIFRVSGACYE